MGKNQKCDTNKPGKCDMHHSFALHIEMTWSLDINIANLDLEYACVLRPLDTKTCCCQKVDKPIQASVDLTELTYWPVYSNNVFQYLARC